MVVRNLVAHAGAVGAAFARVGFRGRDIGWDEWRAIPDEKR
jgi:hypothetical protein